MEDLSVIFDRTDTMGNRFEMEGENLFLVLRKDGKKRNLGRIFHNKKDGKLQYVKHESNKDIFRANESWSIPYYIVMNVDYLQIITEDKDYRITAEHALDVGSFLWFKDSGFEKKFYIPLSDWWTGKI